MTAEAHQLSSLLRTLLLVSVVVIVFMIMKPDQFRTLGQKARTLGLGYVLAILISACMYLLGWSSQ